MVDWDILKMINDKMIKDVLYCIDGKNDLYVKLLEMSMMSMVENYGMDVRFHVIYSNLDEMIINNLTREYDVKFYPFPSERFERGMKIFQKRMQRVAHPSIFYRLFACEILPVKVNKVFHLDVDMVCYNPFEISMENSDVMMKGKNVWSDTSFSRRKILKSHGLNTAINGGINVFNLEEMRKKSFLKKCLELCQARQFQYEEELMWIVANNVSKTELFDNSIMQHVMYDSYPKEKDYFLHFIFFKRRSGNLIHPRFRERFDFYYNSVVSTYALRSKWDWSVPSWLKPFRYVPYWLRKIIRSREKLL